MYTSRSKGSQQGLHLQDVLGVLRGKGINMQSHELVNFVHVLCDEGKLYSTVDDNHHKPTSEDY